MKRIEIIGDNYIGRWDNTRTACRGIIIQNSRILMSCETLTDQWSIPGGGLEDGEDELTCCAREMAEETGLLVRPSECVLEIDEYYGNWKWVNRYFFCEVTGKTDIHLTDREKEAGMEPGWVPLDEIIRIFSRYADCADEMKRGMYLRELTALNELINGGQAGESFGSTPND